MLTIKLVDCCSRIHRHTYIHDVEKMPSTNKPMNLFSITIILILAINLTLVNATCENRDQVSKNGEQFAMLTTKEKVKDFFVGVGCGIQNGARSVTQKVKNGYIYVKNKIVRPKPNTEDRSESTDGNAIIQTVTLPINVDPPIDVRFGNSREAIIEQRFRRHARFAHGI